MARPAEKARSMLNKWVSMREKSSSIQQGGSRRRRPKLVQDCENVNDAQKFRNQLIREISGKMSEIQNPGLAEEVLRELNDEINRLFREKHMWNKRIHELGGPNFIEIEKQRQIEEGQQQYFGYQYYGAAKDLPGVKELLEKRAQSFLKERQQDFRHITPSYYGWEEEDDGVLLELEALATKQNEELYGRGPSGEYTATSPGGASYYLQYISEDAIAEKLLEIKKKALLEEFNL